MKNKKGGKAQKFLNTISKQTATSGKSPQEVSPELLLCCILAVTIFRHRKVFH